MLRQQEEPFLEKLALILSLFSGILFLSVELMAAWTTRSQGIWADSIYDLGETLFLAVFTFLLVFLKGNEQRNQVRQIFTLSKNAFLAVLLTALIWENLRVLFSGGHVIDPHQVWGMELGLCGLAAAVTLLLAILARGSSSEAVRSEVVCWAIDVAGCAGMILAYGLCARFGEQMPWLTRYADSLIAILLSVPALIGVLRMLRDNLAVCSIPRIKHDFS
ncbi:MAG: cation transporter [Ruminiclostridium sp.]|nr:cation transporter [Ruminiclostridium sp.]